MDNYMSVKLIKAEPMELSDFNDLTGRNISSSSSETQGYMVEYPDGYKSWSPKSAFEKHYMRVTPNPRLKTNVSISQSMVDEFIKEKHVTTLGDKTTLVRVVLNNGFEITESSACVDKENYSEELGAEVCMEKIKDKVWSYLGFLLQTAVGGVR